MKKIRILRIIFPFSLIPFLILMIHNEEGWKEQMGEDVFWGLFAALIIMIVVGTFGFAFQSMYKYFSGSYTMFWGNGKKANRIIKKGYRGIATLISLSETKDGNLTINDQPVLFMELAIEDQDDEVFNTGFNVLIPRSELPQFIPGKRFPVFIDPEDRKNIVLDTAKIMELQNPKITAGEEFTDEDRKVIKEMGKQALAKLIRLEDTGKSSHFQTIVKFVYEIHIAGEPTYQIETEVPLREKAALKIRSSVGTSFHARVHPFDKYKVIIDLQI